jgi:hypothetical protein
MNGIWLEPNSLSGTTELYICATYISTGILRSNNFKGNVSYDVSKDEYSIDVGSASEGMYINLNEGFIWGKEFNLSGSGDNGTVVLKTNPNTSSDTDYYFYSGNTDNYIKLSGKGNLSLKS